MPRLAQRPGSVPEISRRLPHSRLEPAIAHYYTNEMIRCITDMLRHAITPEPARALHHRAQKLLWEIEDDAEYEMYCHDVASFEYAYPPTAARPQPATADV